MSGGEKETETDRKKGREKATGNEKDSVKRKEKDSGEVTHEKTTKGEGEAEEEKTEKKKKNMSSKEKAAEVVQKVMEIEMDLIDVAKAVEGLEVDEREDNVIMEGKILS